MNIYQKVSTILALSLFLPLAWQILTGKVKQNIATFILWGSLDMVAATSIFVQGGNWYLPTAYTVGSFIIVACLVKTKIITWTWFETAMSVMVVICIVGWYLSGPWLATVMSSIGLLLASLPQIKDAYKIPTEMPLLIYTGYMSANVIATLGGSDWTVEERMYSVTAVIACAFIVLFSCRRFYTFFRE